ncbi:L,D-transpeptidase family protein [Pseudoflavitalea sp. G-6-1-2]|uniref:L,D-transpeptidase family protein n=1 Tax=Pseudoflavitalea sp. G-6-1-2 TaxID=2728841 RepID=UPI00146BA0C8|nr:L,D-transpeptidase family protein [Pseudoflavitalea sp. G-6-1-2]NML20896.1 L,D-transpeptidase family protein [Pseudoflavitalea sp. G-6-1-2]
MNRILQYLTVTAILFSACKGGDKKNTPAVAPRDTTINTKNSYSGLFFDSTTMEKFLGQEKIPDSMADRIRSFYNARNYQYAWFLDGSIAEYVPTFIEMQNSYIAYSGDSSIYDPKLSVVVDSIKNGKDSFNVKSPLMVNTELNLTKQFFRFANRAWAGSNEQPKDLEWFIPRKKINVASLLDSLIQNKGKDVSRYEPVNRQYNLLKEYLLKSYEIEKAGGWPAIPAIAKKVLKQGDSTIEIVNIKKRLFVSGDLKENDSSQLFTSALTDAVKNFQTRYGFTADGKVNNKLVTEMNRPIGERIRQILVNMERIRWVPAEPPPNYLLINIPEYRMHVYENGNLMWDMGVVVGTPAHNTVIFSGDLKYVVFSPYWNVPPGILKNEVLPGIKRNPNYLARHHMEWNGKAVRQLPGPWNSLGGVKFLFPNSYNIYLHDTPSRSLFDRDQRAFSHGCIRLHEPAKLAQYLLRNDPKWDSTKIAAAMKQGKEQYVTLKETVPVYIGYFTAWVDRAGRLNFREDVYGHDKKMDQHLLAMK